ncbi:hypothetical protein BDN70DRAFT_342408 [Pholiota conissans]|uniref:Uncharacterized protein n=1 Tax=Pholiota conissans TaxID=109636 RepID=A0A9P6D481_9AGAR|nr:hypothetical protein BDN70DRAFT_342408 [Pholiota conissans]
MTDLTNLTRSDVVYKLIGTPKPVVIAAPQKDNDNDDETIRVPAEPATDSSIDTSMFDVFNDFNLDLSCLSPPGSPVASTSSLHLPPSTPSPPTSPILSRSISFATQAPQASTLTAKKSKKASTPNLTSTAPAGTRGSWPLVKYTGRGTPIDRNRRLEWGGFSGDENVAEDGLLFSGVRSTSLDSNAIRPSQRSLSPEWNMSSSLSHSMHTRSLSESQTSHKDASIHEPPPELAPLEGLGLNKQDEWDSIMKTVLSPTTEPEEEVEPPTPSDTNNAHENVSEDLKAARFKSISTSTTNPAAEKPVVQLTPEQMEQLNNGLEMDLGINAALDLGLGRRGGMNWFDLGFLPASSSGRDSPSIYSSQMATPRASSPASLRQASEHRSMTSTKAEVGNGNGNGAGHETKSEPSSRWWQKMLLRMRRVHTIITIHKNR